MSRFKQIEHTADIGVEIDGASLRELFINAANGMSGLMFTRHRDVSCFGRFKYAVSIKAGSREELLVRWLEEILYLFDCGGKVACDFEISEIDDMGLKGAIIACAFDPLIHTPRHQIKAVTYHNLEIKEDGGRFSTVIIFDI